MRTVPLDFVGPEAQSRSKFWSNQGTLNMYIDQQGTGRSPLALLPWPGEKLFSTGGGGTPRLLVTHDDQLYKIEDETLFLVDSAGTRTSVGTIPGTGRCTAVSDSSSLIIRTGSATYRYLGGVSQITDPDLENAQSLAFLNSQVIYQGSGARFGVANAGDPTTIDALNYATAEAVGDDLKQIYAFNELLYLGGSNSMEVWSNIGTGTPPFDRIQSSTSQIGVSSAFSMANSERYLYFMGSDGLAYRTNQFQPQSITPSAMAREFAELDRSDVQGYVVRLQGQSFYILQFPTSSRTYAFSEETQEWIQLASGNNIVPLRHLMDGYAYCYGKHFVIDRNNCNVYEWDIDTYDSNGSVIIRQRDTAPINGMKLGAPGQRLVMSKAEIMMETGVGNLSVPNPKIMVSASYDGGRSFTNEDWIEIGRSGSPVKRIEWYNSASFYDIILRVKISDAAFLGIHGAAITLKEAGY